MTGLRDRDQAHRLLADEPRTLAEAFDVLGFRETHVPSLTTGTNSGVTPAVGGGDREQRMCSGAVPSFTWPWTRPGAM